MPTMVSHGADVEILGQGGCTDMTLKLLILGGTSEGRLLAAHLANEPRYDVLLSFAGRTESLQRPAVPHRVGGFGGVPGLVACLQEQRFDALIDATHAFAAQMSHHAVTAAEAAGIPLLRIEIPAWREGVGDHWQNVPDMQQAALALGPAPRRVFLSIGRLEVAAFAAAPQHDYLIRAVDAFEPPLPRARVLALRGPFVLNAERALFTRERIDIIVSKNAGTAATYAKVEAARDLFLPVIMVERPRLPQAQTVASVEQACAWLEAIHGALSRRRGV